jgi:hypothetical protein
MTDKQTPPDWVLLEAAKRSGIIQSAEFRRMTYEDMPMFRALCDMIERYEQPPPDRKLLCAREAAKEYGYDQGDLAENACIRAIELWEGKFGK